MLGKSGPVEIQASVKREICKVQNYRDAEPSRATTAPMAKKLKLRQERGLGRKMGVAGLVV